MHATFLIEPNESKNKKMYWNRAPKVQQESSQWWDVFHNQQSKGMFSFPKRQKFPN